MGQKNSQKGLIIRDEVVFVCLKLFVNFKISI